VPLGLYRQPDKNYTLAAWADPGILLRGQVASVESELVMRVWGRSPSKVQRNMGSWAKPPKLKAY